MLLTDCGPLPDRTRIQALRIMKLTFILLTAAFLQVSAKGVAQRVTLSLKDVSMERVFREIEKQTGYGFLYTRKMLKDLPLVSVNVKDAPVEQVLDNCLSGQAVDYSIESQTIIIHARPYAAETTPTITPPPPINVHGRVVNDK